MKIRVKTGPSAEPVTTTDARGSVRVDGTWSDTELAGLITAGRQAAESFTDMTIPLQTLEYALDAYPSGPIKLPKGPLVSLQGITLTDKSGVTVSVESGTYIVDTFSATLTQRESAPLPNVDLQEANGIIIEYQAGFAVVPETIKQAILLYVKAQYDCIPPEIWISSFEKLLWPYKEAMI